MTKKILPVRRPSRLFEPSREARDEPGSLGEQVRACLRRYLSRPSAEIESVLGFVEERELIHRDNLVIL